MNHAISGVTFQVHERVVCLPDKHGFGESMEITNMTISFSSNDKHELHKTIDDEKVVRAMSGQVGHRMPVQFYPIYFSSFRTISLLQCVVIPQFVAAFFVVLCQENQNVSLLMEEQRIREEDKD